MKRALIGTRRGKRAFNWPAVLLTGAVVGLVAGSSAAGAWFLLTQEFSVAVILFAVALSMGWFIGDAARGFCCLPSDQLTRLD